VFQGIFGKPLWVHGEGLTVTGAAERKSLELAGIRIEDLTLARMRRKWVTLMVPRLWERIAMGSGTSYSA
jgi:hypothetical protein